MRSALTMLFAAAVISGAMAATTPFYKTINRDNPGQRVKITNFLAPGKTSVFAFVSDYCSDCTRLKPMLKQLTQQRSDVVVLKVNVNRPGVRVIDYNSPVALQYGARDLPYFIIYNRDGALVSQGDAAYQTVMNMLHMAGIQ
ncbi:MAG: thioredoxin family protein [Armatimonadetes bacterium]|nr:thioredoxin family protein [Armatimonadota bacterium]